MASKFSKAQPVAVLNIGTRILVKDVMDQYLRSLGEVKTYYASKLSSAIESYQERRPGVIFCEQSFPEGNALEFIEAIGGLDSASERYFVLAAEEVTDQVVALSMEKGIDEVLVKPFATDDVLQIMDRFAEKREMSSIDWVRSLRAARQAFQEKRFQEADELYGETAKQHWGSTVVLLDCAEYFLARQQSHKSLPLLEKVLQESPDHVRALHLHGCVLRRLGRLQDAAGQLLRANTLSPLNTLRNVELSELYLAMAEEQIVNALKSDSESTHLILRRAQSQLVRKDYRSMLSYLDSKRSFLSESGKKEAENLIGVAKKLGGMK